MQRIIELITKNVKNRLEDKYLPDFIAWLIKLKDGDNTDQRLLCCLGIDIKYNLIEILDLIKIFEKVEYSKALSSSKASHYFESTLRDNPALHNYGLEFRSYPPFKQQFVRIMTLNTFNSYFYNRIEGIDDVKLANDKILEEIKRDQLDNVKMPNDGPPFRKCAWITPLSPIKSLIKESKVHSLNLANIITDYLGLNIDPTSPDYIYIEYPLTFKEATFQPCALNANWYETARFPGLYISYKKMDKYGRTRSRIKDDSTKRLKERIHKPIDSKYHYKIKYLGRADDFNFSIDEIGNESLKRFLM